MHTSSGTLCAVASAQVHFPPLALGPLPRRVRALPCAVPSTSSRRRQRSTAAVPKAVLAAQKKVFKSFDNLINAPEPVLVAFYATWCGPCVMLGKVLDEIAPSLRGRLRFVKVDSERYPSIASRFQVRALPTMVLFRDGQPVDRVEGVLGPSDLRARLDYMLSQQSST